MYSYYLRKFAKAEFGGIGDGNPGVLNLWKRAGWKWGVTGMVLDYLKGIFPLLIFILTGFISNRYAISAAALAGIAGHAFSPFLKFKGGKSITTTFGAWTVISKWEGPVIFGSILGILYLYVKIRKKRSTEAEDAIIVLFAFLGLLVYTFYNILKGNYALMILYFGNVAIVLYKHSRELSGVSNIRFRRRNS